jgi:CRISPR-associated protein Cmr2
MTNELTSLLWQTKVAARLHDPAEKALVLFRDRAGHEGGTRKDLQALLDLPEDFFADKRPDWWAAAGDRPQWPRSDIVTKTGKTVSADGGAVRWASDPELIHPLTGQRYDLHNLTDTEVGDIKARSFKHFEHLQQKTADGTTDWKKTLLAYWRFGPELKEDADNVVLGKLWSLLPADTRIPDHSIWDHLDLTSAFAGAFAADPQGDAALLTLSIGPVQGFIAAARSTSDLWAGSHLLSRLAWETMRPLCDALGPDAILFPRLRGIPQVDLWLRDKMDLPESLFEGCEWNQGATDANPLFSAALPNRFVAVVPASRARDLAETCAATVREWVQDVGQDVVSRLLHAAGEDVETPTPYEQMNEQLQGFPEVHWAVVPFSLIRCNDVKKQRDLDITQLKVAMSPFFGVGEDVNAGFLDTDAWRVLQKELQSGGATFFAPNPGVLYPAIFDLAERALAATKSARVFEQQAQNGWRCSLTGEAEWLTTNREQLKTSYRQRKDTLWAKIAQAKPSWAKSGEHLSALPAIKRLWSAVFLDELKVKLEQGVDRFVVSTHTMALAHQLENWLKTASDPEANIAAGAVALPRRLARRYGGKAVFQTAKRLPGLLDEARDSDNEEKLKKAQDRVKGTLDVDTLEAYYAFIMLDGDHMGAILSGDETDQKNQITYRESFHSKTQVWFNKIAEDNPQIQAYGQQKRPISPNRHQAISGALNDFSQTVVRHVVEHEHLGRVIYSGGDDVLAMLPVADLLSAMRRLRESYSGESPKDEKIDHGLLGKRDKLVCKDGFAWLNERLMRMMGENATASCGAVIAHHQAPLSAVMRELRTAEKRAKGEGGRDAFSITVIKRSGGALLLTAKWGVALDTLNKLIDFLRADEVSRRAVYHTLTWLKDLPEPHDGRELLEKMLAYQLNRQSGNKAKEEADELASRLVELTLTQEKTKQRNWLENFLTVGEFLARETRDELNQGDRP